MEVAVGYGAPPALISQNPKGGPKGWVSRMGLCMRQRQQEGGPHSCSQPPRQPGPSQGQGQTAAWPRPTPGPFWETRRSLFLLCDNTTEAAAGAYLCAHGRALPQRQLCALGLCGPPPPRPSWRQGGGRALMRPLKALRQPGPVCVSQDRPHSPDAPTTAPERPPQAPP